ncbi:MAG: dihydroneopterin aldolase, partial [Dehalococcoidia bacterium]|nr:dihydroneopterin aldolase [Dehalococcoidia bacterium]
MADRIVLAGMRFFGYHGALPEERTRGQEFVVDVEVEADLREAGKSD